MVSALQRRGFKRASRGVVPLGASLCRQMESIPQVCKLRSPVRSSPRRWFTTASERSKEHHSPGTDKHPVLHFSYSFFCHTLSLPATDQRIPRAPPVKIQSQSVSRKDIVAIPQVPILRRSRLPARHRRLFWSNHPQDIYPLSEKDGRWRLENGVEVDGSDYSMRTTIEFCASFHSIIACRLTAQCG